MFKQNNAREFIVEEITRDGIILEVDKAISFPSVELTKDFFCVFVLQKTNWNTMQAITEVSRRLRVKPNRLSFAGTKDRTAVTTQLVSCFALEPHRISSLSIKDVSINGVWVSDKKIGLGDL
ncbi:MAG: tRNA pseudouridine(13) synthase TruD, partial [Candidatus Micrarchaeota archaeon]